MSTLQRHVPELALEWAAETPDELWRQIDGTLCFADISGFTALAERLAQRGRMGGEELIETLGRVFSEMLDVAHARGGSLLKFGGDALLLLFRGEDHANQAASAAVEMRLTLRRAAEIPTSVGPLRLSMSVGLHAGLIDFFLVGESHRELILLGPAADKVVETENTANAREIVVSPETAVLLRKGATRPREDGQLLLRWRKAPVPAIDAVGSDHAEDLVRSLFPDELGRHLAAGPPDPEHRVACIAFVRFSGTDAVLANDGPEALARALQTTVAGIQEILTDEGVTLLAIDLDTDGGKFFLAAGVPHSREDDEGVMLRAMRRIVGADFPLSLQAGVNRGHVFAAEVGTSHRAAFSAMGDTTNTAARIAGKTPPGSIYAHPSVLDECMTRFQVEQAGPLTMKGKTEPQVVYQVGEELGLREREGLEVADFIGRREELGTLCAAVTRSVEGVGQVISLVGETGLGKTRLIDEATASLTDREIIRLRAEPYGANSPYRMFRDVVRSILGIARGPARTMQRSLAHAIDQLNPGLTARLPLIGDIAHIEVDPTPEVDAIEAEFRPDRTADVLIELLVLTRPDLVALVVDDAHWCDEASSQLLSRLEKASIDYGWLILLTRRDADGGFRADSGSTLDIGPMPDVEIGRLVHAATEAAPLLPNVVQRIVERSAGYPLFAIEIVRAVRNAGSHDALPESLGAAFTTQVDALDRHARRLLSYAAVLGRSFSLDVLEELLTSEGHEFDAGVLERLQEFLHQEAGARLRFRNGLLRDTIYEGLSYRLRRRLHRHAGEALESRSDDPESIADALALHFSSGEDFERTWKYARIAGQRAMESYANSDAARNFEIALAAARRNSAPDPTALLQTWMDLGESRELSRSLDKAFEAYRHALRLTRDDPLARAELMYKRSWAKHEAELFSSALRDITTGANLVSSLNTTAAKRQLAQLEALRAGIYYVQDRPRQAVRAAERATEIARDANEHESLIRALWVLELASISLYGPGDGHYLQEALPLAQALKRPGLQAVTTMNLGALDSYAGRWDQAVDWFKQAHILFAEVGNDIDAAYCDVNTAEIRVSQRRLEEAESRLDDAMRIMKAAHFSEGVATIQIELARIRLEQDRLEDAMSLSSSAAAELDLLGQHHFVLQALLVKATALVRRGNPESALELIDEALRAGGDDAAHLKPKTAEVRARAYAALNRIDDALAQLGTGLGAARHQDLPHDEAVLLSLRYELDRKRDALPNPADLQDAAAIFETLGVVQ